MSDKPRVRYHKGRYVPIEMFDSLSNLVANIGTERDKRSHNRFGAGTPAINWVELEGAYIDNWIAKQIVNVPVDDGLREWRSFKIDDPQVIKDEEERLKLAYNYKLARYWARLYGGSVILMITNQDLSEPLDVNKIKQGDLYRLVVLDRWDIKPQQMNFYNPVAEDYLQPEFYSVVSGTQQIHSSHVIRVEGEDLPRRMRALNEGWGDSTLRKVLEDLKDVVSTKGGIASMVLEANVDTITREGLSQELASNQEEKILQRFALAGQMKSLVNMMLLDGNETMERKSLSFQGLAQIMDKFMIWISGAAEIPMTRLFGRSAAGMNATGEGDLNNYYDSVASMQKSEFEPDLNKLDEVMIRSAMGSMPEDLEWEWNPLYQESGIELAQQDLALAQSEDIRLEQGILKPSHIAIRMKEEGKYAIEDDHINELQEKEKEEALFEEEMRKNPELMAGLGGENPDEEESEEGEEGEEQEEDK